MTSALPKSSRASRIATWLASQRAPLAVNLQLEIKGEEQIEVVAQWERTSQFVATDVAREADAALQNVADELESRVHGRLAYYTAEGKLFSQFQVKCEPSGEIAQTFEGTAKSLLQQQQKHYEIAGHQYFKSTEGVHKVLLETVTVLKDLIVTRETRGQELEAEIADLRAENSQLQANAERAERVMETAVKAADEATKAVEDLKAKGGDDAAIGKMLMDAVTNKVLPSAPAKQ